MWQYFHQIELNFHFFTLYFYYRTFEDTCKFQLTHFSTKNDFNESKIYLFFSHEIKLFAYQEPAVSLTKKCYGAIYQHTCEFDPQIIIKHTFLIILILSGIRYVLPKR